MASTDYDRLELEVWTDGRGDPRDAVARAAMILREHLAVFIESDGTALGGAASTPVAGLTDDEGAG